MLSFHVGQNFMLSFILTIVYINKGCSFVNGKDMEDSHYCDLVAISKLLIRLLNVLSWISLLPNKMADSLFANASLGQICSSHKIFVQLISNIGIVMLNLLY